MVNANEKLVLRGTIQAYEHLNNTVFFWEVLEGVLDLDAYPSMLGTPRNRSAIAAASPSPPGARPQSRHLSTCSLIL